jgi:hypothetical protein
MPLVPQTLFQTLFPAFKDAAKEAMVLYNRSINPNDNGTETINTNFGPPVIINLNTESGNNKVDLDKASEVFGNALAAKLVPILVNQIDTYIKTGGVTIPPGQAIAGTSPAGPVTGAAISPSPIGTIS